MYCGALYDPRSLTWIPDSEQTTALQFPLLYLPQLMSEVIAFAWYCLYCLLVRIVLEFDFVLVIRALLFLAVIGLWHFGSEIFFLLGLANNFAYCAFLFFLGEEREDSWTG